MRCSKRLFVMVLLLSVISYGRGMPWLNKNDYQILTFIPDENVPAIITRPETYILYLKERYEELDEVTIRINFDSSFVRAFHAYCKLLQNILVGNAYLDAEMSVNPGLGQQYSTLAKYNAETRLKGHDHPYLGLSMIGFLRMQSLQDILITIMQSNIDGDFVETGVWRGGASMFAQGVIRGYHYAHLNSNKKGSEKRKVFVCDSFQGLPEGNKLLHPADTGWDNFPYMSVKLETVKKNFERFSLLDDDVVFVKGFFNVTMRALVKQRRINSISILRMDGDIYSSTMDVLYNLYDKVSVGGYVIIDDWEGFPAQNAVLDFFSTHDIYPSLVRVDDLSVFWRKDKHINIMYKKYLHQYHHHSN
eukprot:c22556_g1_i1.p1 GENE.c22556_g1_i1~~c22556_g1_i1.p1  ORF type:complete len:361 (+),score=-31.31 c22556_g1_i1:47-1129(+)